MGDAVTFAVHHPAAAIAACVVSGAAVAALVALLHDLMTGAAGD